MPLKRTALRAAAAVLTFAALSIPALAATGTVSTGGDTLRVRAEGNTAAEVLENLNDGTQVEVLGITEDGWYKISSEAVEGFVSGDFLVVDEAEAAELPKVAEPFYVKVDTAALNVRSAPSTDSEKVSQLAAGRVVKVLEETDGWYHIETGYISAEYAVKVDPSEISTASSKGQEVANLALSLVGSPYRYGGSSPSGFDCSGFTTYLYKQFGVTLNRTASGQLSNGTSVSRDQLQPGDLVMFKSGGGSKPASHVGLYIGGGKIVHAATSSKGVVISSLSQSYYRNAYVGARRIFN